MQCKSTFAKKRFVQWAINLLVILLSSACVPKYDGIRVAAAANTQSVLNEISVQFYKETGVIVEMVYGSSGALTAQIRQGAPYDIFLSADVRYPQVLFNAGLTVDSVFIYAKGRLVIASKTNNCKNLNVPNPGLKVAIANEKLAPYGEAAIQFLARSLASSAVARCSVCTLGNVENNWLLIRGESIGQVNQFIESGAVDFGITSLSSALNAEGWYYCEIPADCYESVNQGMVSLTASDDVKKFVAYLKSPKAQNIFSKHGYELP